MMRGLWKPAAVVMAVAVALLTMPGAAAAIEQSGAVTFTKDVLPILQNSCQTCHRPGTPAPMSLLNYEEVRPWATAIKRRVVNREMPPWHVDRTVGIREYIGDRSLSDEEIATVAQWVDSGTPRGNPADAPAPLDLAAFDNTWEFGEPDLVVTSEEFVLPTAGPDLYPSLVADTGLTEDRWIKWIEFKPGDRRVVHHAMMYAIQEDPEFLGDQLSRGAQGSGSGRMIIEYAVGNQGDYFADNTGRLLRAGGQIRFSMHYHSVGEEVHDVSKLGIKFYPKGQEPEHRVISLMLSTGTGSPETGLGQLSIPPFTDNVRHDRYFRLERPAIINTFQPHMHFLGKAMSLEAIYPDGRREMLTNVDKYDFNWQIAYAYKNPPVLPTGSVLHVTSYHDNTANNRYNPDSSSWIGWGSRTIDEMGNGWVELAYMTEEDYQEYLEKQSTTTEGNNE